MHFIGTGPGNLGWIKAFQNVDIITQKSPFLEFFSILIWQLLYGRSIIK